MAKNDTILVTPEILDSRAATLTSYKEEHIANMKKLDALVATVDSVWKGDSQLAYTDEYKSLKKNATKVANLLENYSKTITGVANRMRTVDEQTVSTAEKYTNS